MGVRGGCITGCAQACTSKNVSTGVCEEYLYGIRGRYGFLMMILK